ncbi:2,3-bisphosphoglycerate-independent phosphoglycerate mutase [Sulfobacillus harzensis]|uniref:2,3-bisphosphoglycerate-independent phosphoglycerate mutase n=1 Tax=Sulfobacillus harzensis TaxID=2729629 RepID=A0A7Y0L374_9FIRM|nr:2,3-bisphosphoglycerate-independent phosphoglycerate mutase [Sulfobacillus harzensis]NMP22147.1 2,3-bisphosphoglycerate-independent phosphoglycerate mutase [Sulfobacillus harzensis]
MRPVVLMVLDGWGLAPDSKANAIASAPEAHYRKLRETYPSTEVQAHGRAVGLMPDQMGDSNVGHLTIGAGRIVQQNLPRITDAVESGELAKNPVLQEALRRARGHRLHLMGLLSPGGVHSHQAHLKGILDIVKEAGLKDVYIHVWLDGRDVPPSSAMSSLEFLANAINSVGVGQVATVAGRYYAMDRDRRWDRTEKAYRAMVEGNGRTARSAPEALDQSYQEDTTDEFVVPTVIVNADGKPVTTIDENDVVLVFNFRADRVRQITRALADPEFDAFSRPFKKVAVYGMTEYDEDFELPHLFDRPSVPHNLAEWLSKHDKSQLHVAETEKYAHVTFFFNGGQEKVYPGEDRILIPSPKVATYDQAPEMSAKKIADAVVKDLEQGRHEFILLNFANADMVGHTGKLESAQEAVRAADAEIGRIADAVLNRHGLLAIVSDHGNAEVMQDENGKPNTNHTTNPVPFAIIAESDWLRGRKLKTGGLQDVAPTLLDLMGMSIPSEMAGHSLLTEGERE